MVHKYNCKSLVNKNVFCKNTPYRSEIESKSRGISLNTTKYHGFCGVCKVRRHEQFFLYSHGAPLLAAWHLDACEHYSHGEGYGSR